MSRSYKQMPIVKDGTPGSRRKAKRLANKVVRRSQYVADGKYYCRLYESWNIYDYAFHRPLWCEFEQWEEEHGRWIEPDGQQAVKNRWAKWYFRK